jgi:hypothetical protein
MSIVAVIDMVEDEREGCATIPRLRNIREALLLGVDSVECKQAEEK